MDELEQSLKYVPTFQVIERIRKEEKQIAKEKLAVERGKTKAEKTRLEKLKHATANALLTKGVPIEEIAKIMDISIKNVHKLINIDN